jgi:hypothetical protein
MKVDCIVVIVCTEVCLLYKIFSFPSQVTCVGFCNTLLLSMLSQELYNLNKIF